MKKLTALLLALVMVLAMNATAFAVNMDSSGKVASDATELTIPTTIVITNNEGATAAGKVIAYPAMSFKHEVAIATVEDGSTVTDASSNTARVKAGIAGGLTVQSDPGVAAGIVTLDANGQNAITASTTFEVDLTKFNKTAGIYRYKITDTSVTDATTKAALEQAGVVMGADTDTEYFLDVYLVNDESAASGLKVSGYVLTAKNNKVIDGTPTGNEAAAEKKPGFGEDPDPTVSGAPYPINSNYSYTTYNVILNKEVEGSLGDKQNGFPFTVNVVNNSLKYDFEVTGSTNSSLDKALESNTVITGNVLLGDGSTLKIWGLSPFATVQYTETNNTEDTYKTKVGNTAGTDDVQAEADLAKNGTKDAFAAAQEVATGYVLNGTTATLNAAADAIYFTNTLNDVSQTGVVLRFAPYALMLGAGIALFIILKVRKNKAVEEA